MEKRIHLYVSRKNPFLWLSLLAMLASIVLRIVPACVFSGFCPLPWVQLVLPIATLALFMGIVLFMGGEMLYKTTIPVFMMGIFYGVYVITSSGLKLGVLLPVLFSFTLLFFCVMYTLLISGRIRAPWLLTILDLAALALLGYLHFYMKGKEMSVDPIWYLLPEYLYFSGYLLLTFATRVHHDDKYHPTWGDRSDGRRIRTLPPMAQVSPYIMVTRNTSSNFFTDSIEITNIERYIRQKRREGYSNFGLTHVLLAAYVRGVAKYPGLNRFLAGQKVYSRDTDIQYCMTIKKEMVNNAPDTVVKVHLHPGDTAIDVYNKLNAQIEKVKATPLDSNFDNTAGALTLIPGVFLKFTVWLLRTLDYFGLLPKFLLEVSPFHGSLFYTSMGSLGIQPIYHHLYDFGNMPAFGAFGCKRKVFEMNEEGELVPRKYVDIKFVLDERIVDGYYYATFFKYFKRILARPEVLDNPPEEIVKDID